MKDKFIEFFSRYVHSILSLAFFMLAWQALIPFFKKELFFSTPLNILHEGFELIVSGYLAPHLMFSLGVLLVGFLAALILGIISGIILGLHAWLRSFLNPYVYLLNTTPLIAIMPLLIIWFGIGISSKIFIVFLMAFVPILISTIEGIKNVDASRISMARSFGAGTFEIIKSVMFLDALPFIISGARIAIGRSLIGLVLSEAFGSGKGIGYLVSFYGITFQTSRLMFIVFLFFFLAFVANMAVFALEKKMLRYRN